jgi:nucleoside deoxyribosyltransferase
MIYLAGPFFTQEQALMIRNVEALLLKYNIEHFSPSRDQRQLNSAVDAAEKLWIGKQVFQENIYRLTICRTVLACIDDFDPGTIWEMGYAAGLGRKEIIAFTTQHHGLNLMLRESCSGFLSGLEEIEAWLRGDLKPNAWRGAVI